MAEAGSNGNGNGKLAQLEPCVTVKNVSDILSVSEGHVYMLVKTGHLKAIDISCSGKAFGTNSIRITVKSVADFQKKRKIDPGKRYDGVEQE